MTDNKDLRYTFKYSERLHFQKDFDRTIRNGRRAVHPAVFVYSFERKDGFPGRRMGLVTSSKIGNAVNRNRVKRLLREIFRLNKHRVKPGTDLVFIPKKDAVGISFKKLQETVLLLLKKMDALI